MRACDYVDDFHRPPPLALHDEESSGLLPSGWSVLNIAARVGQVRSGVIGMVSVQTPGNSQTRDAQCLAARSNFDCFKVPLVNRCPEGFDFRVDLDGEDLFEAPFFAVSCEAASPCASRASQSRSLTSTSSFAIARKHLHSAIWARVVSTAWGGITFVTVFPATARVSDQLGPWPREPS